MKQWIQLKLESGFIYGISFLNNKGFSGKTNYIKPSAAAVPNQLQRWSRTAETESERDKGKWQSERNVTTNKSRRRSYRWWWERYEKFNLPHWANGEIRLILCVFGVSWIKTRPWAARQGYTGYNCFKRLFKPLYEEVANKNQENVDWKSLLTDHTDLNNRNRITKMGGCVSFWTK